MSGGRYRIQRALARGGMAEVFLAVDERSGRPVVVKRMLPALAADPMFRALFVDEARLAVQLRHENIVAVEDVGFEHGDFFMALEYVDGIDVEELVDRLAARGDHVPLRGALAVARAVLAALVYAHEKEGVRGALGIVHRDVNPGNVIVSRAGDVKLLDFGIARCAEQAHKTAPGIVIGKPGFMAPEQAAGRRADVRTDVYGVAGLIAYLLTGKPIDDETPARLRAATAPRALVDVVVRALSPDPQERPASARVFAAALDACEDEGDARELLADLVERVLPPPMQDAARLSGGPFTVSAAHTLGTPAALSRTASEDDATVPASAPVDELSATAPVETARVRPALSTAALAALAFAGTFVLVLAIRLLLR